MDKVFDKLIYIFILIQPILDILTSIQLRYLGGLSISSIVRLLVLVIITIYMIIKKYDNRLLYLIFIYFIINLIYLLSSGTILLFMNVLKVFYLPIFILFFNKYSNNKIDYKLILITYSIYLLFIIIPTLFNFSFEAYEAGETKSASLGLFYGGNELSAILLGYLPIVIYYSSKIKKIIIRLLLYISILLSFIFIGTKTLFIGGILVLIIYFIRYIIINKKYNKRIILPFLFILLIIGIIFPYTPVYRNFLITLDYYNIHEAKDLFNYEMIDNVIYSRRLTYSSNIINEYSNSSIPNKLFGIDINNLKDAEIDIIDILVSIGIIGTIIYLIAMIYLVYKYRLKDIYLISFILFILMSLFSGHIFNKVAVSFYIALLFNLNNVNSN